MDSGYEDRADPVSTYCSKEGETRLQGGCRPPDPGPQLSTAGLS